MPLSEPMCNLVVILWNWYFIVVEYTLVQVFNTEMECSHSFVLNSKHHLLLYHCCCKFSPPKHNWMQCVLLRILFHDIAWCVRCTYTTQHTKPPKPIAVHFEVTLNVVTLSALQLNMDVALLMHLCNLNCASIHIWLQLQVIGNLSPPRSILSMFVLYPSHSISFPRSGPSS